MTRQPTPANILDAVLTADEPAVDRLALRRRLRWDYSQVSPTDRKQVEDAAVDILANGQRLQQSAVAIGERLIGVKRFLPHGLFGDWCATEFHMSQKTAENMMNVAREFGDKIETVSILTDSAMYMLAAPSTPEPARQQAIEEAQATGKSPTKSRVREIIAEHKPQPARQRISYAKLCILIEDEIAPTCDLYTVDRRWLADHIEDRLHQRDMTADADEIATAIRDTAEELRQRDQRERRLATARAAAEEADRQRQPQPATPKEFAAAVKAATWGDRTAVDILPPTDAPLPQWADEPTPTHYTARQPHDDRLQPAQRLRALYQAVIDSDDQYGNLTGRFSDTLAVKRDLENMIGHLDFLINAITHPEEATTDA